MRMAEEKLLGRFPGPVLVRYVRRDGRTGHYFSMSHEAALRHIGAKREDWRSYVLYGCDVLEAWEAEPGTVRP